MNCHSDEKVAVYCGTRNLYEDMLPAVKSLLCNSSVDRVWLLIEDDAFPLWVPECVSVRNVGGQTYFREDGPNYLCQWSYMVLMRAALAEEFPQYDRILSLDVDTLVLRNIDPLFGMNLYGYYLAAVHDTGRMDPGYINGGVMFQNLKKLREDGMSRRLISELDTVHHDFTDQEVISALCKGKVLILPGEYNASNWTTRTKDARIRHYAAEEDWRDMPKVERFRKMDWDEVLYRHEGVKRWSATGRTAPALST